MGTAQNTFLEVVVGYVALGTEKSTVANCADGFVQGCLKQLSAACG